MSHWGMGTLRDHESKQAQCDFMSRFQDSVTPGPTPTITPTPTPTPNPEWRQRPPHKTPKALAERHSQLLPPGCKPRGWGVGWGRGLPPLADRGREQGVQRVWIVLSSHYTIQLSQHALCVQLSMCMCAMALRLVLVFRPMSPLSGHSLVAGRRGGPTLFTNLDPGPHTSLELASKKSFSLLRPGKRA